jgi:hypothetical protein
MPEDGTEFGFECVNKERMMLTPYGYVSVISKFE